MIDYTVFDDVQLQQMAVSGDRDAEQELAIRYKVLVKMVSRPYFLMGGDSEDLLQEGMLGLIAAMRTYSPKKGASFKTYAETCIRNRIITAVKAAASKKHTPLNNSVSIDALDTEDENDPQISLLASGLIRKSPEEQVLASESGEGFYSDFVACLSKLETAVLEEFLKGLSYRVIAERLGITEKAVDNAIQRIRRKLAQFIKSGDISES